MTEGFSAEERAAMKARAAEVKKRGTGPKRAAKDLADVVDTIGAMSGTDREVAQALHRIVTEQAPALAPRTWYGMPAYAEGGKVIVFFKAAGKFNTRYAEVGFNEDARLDDGDLWPTAFAVTALTPQIEATLTDLIRRATAPHAQ